MYIHTYVHRLSIEIFHLNNTKITNADCFSPLFSQVSNHDLKYKTMYNINAKYSNYRIKLQNILELLANNILVSS